MKRLEWTYNPESKNNVCSFEDEVAEETENGDFEGIVSGVDGDYMQKEDSIAWSDLDSNVDAVSSQSCKWLLVVLYLSGKVNLSSLAKHFSDNVLIDLKN